LWRPCTRTPPKDYQAKYILEFIDDAPVVTQPQLKLFRWMADYYMCTIGEVINAALAVGAEAQLGVAHSAAPGLFAGGKRVPAHGASGRKIVDALGTTEDGKA
jgi:primosomal protein N' (replication factor Y)